jgi:hypothetical protein
MNARRLIRLPKPKDNSLPHQAELLCTTAKSGALLPLWVIRAGLRLGRSPVHVRSTTNSDRKFKAHLFVAMCQQRL